MEVAMDTFQEYDQYDGLGLAELIRKKEVSAEDVCETAIARIEKVNPKLNAVITPMYDHAAPRSVGACRTGLSRGSPFCSRIC